MSTLLIKMAQAAIEDETLFAPYIQQYASQKSLSWDEVASNLQIGHEQLAKLALCSRPQTTSLSGGILQVANYVGIDHFKLKTFVAEVEGRDAVPTKQVSRLNGTYKARPSRRSWNIMGLIPKRLSWALGAVILLVLFMGAFVFAQPASTSAATLVVNEGQATITRTAARNASELVVSAAGEPQLVNSGDLILVMAGSTAKIHLSDGSEVELTAGTQIDVEELVINKDTYRVGLKVLAGQALSRVVTVLGVGDRFEVSTPSSTASVRGTIFTVATLSATESYISCDEGKVEVTLTDPNNPNAIPQQVTLTPGMEVTAVVGQPLNVKSQQPLEESLPTSAPDASNATGAPQEALVTETESTQSIPVIVPLPSNRPIETGPFENGGTEQVPGNTPGEGLGTGETPPSPTPNPTIEPPVEPVIGETMVTICHHPSESSGNTVTTTVSESALQAHLDHGDTEGACPSPPPDTGNGGNNGNGNGSSSGNSGGSSGGGSSNGNGGGNGNGPKDKQIVY